MAKGFDPLALFAPMLGLTKENLDGLRDPVFQQSLVRTWEGLRSIDPDQLRRIEYKLDLIMARLIGDPGNGAVTGQSVAGSRSEPDDGATGSISQDRAA